ncbi:MAG: TlpA family protein disulfide reductase [Magnetovibrio sp.]|nr:TlpA family protein disulfide reductase [Magnetovibrio sp.]
MDRMKSQSNKAVYPTKALALLRFCVIGLCAIVMISGRVASVEAQELEIPQELAHKMRPAVTKDGAFDTPFFNAAQEEITLKSLKGRGVVMNFWATWCAPCVREMPELNRLAKILEGTGVEVMAISADRKPLKKIKPFYEANNLNNLDIYYDERSQLSRKIGVEGLPTTVLLGANGEIAGRVMGVLEWDDPEIVKYITQLLAPQTQ